MRNLSIAIALLFVFPATGLSAIRCEDLFGRLTKQQVNLQLATRAGLHYTDSNTGGMTREKNEDGFQYLTSTGQRITDAATLSRIERLKIPPAWVDVWISADPLSHVQARGFDSRGRSQSRYHQVWLTEVKDVSKFDRMSRFGAAMPGLRDVVAHDLEGAASSETTRIAAVVRLMETAGIRVGGEKYAQENEHYGLTTLLVLHAQLKTSRGKPKTVVFDFVGKEGRHHEIEIEDAAIYRIVKQLVAGKDADRSLFEVSSQAVNKYIKTQTSTEFSAKDIRTWVGTTTAAKSLIEAGAPRNPEEQKKAESQAAIAASQRLRNEPNTARDNYIDPVIFTAYRTGRLAELATELRSTDLNAVEALVLRLLTEDREAI